MTVPVGITSPRGWLWQIPLACIITPPFIVLRREGVGRSPSPSSNPRLKIRGARGVMRRGVMI